jgi:hypothetical protein
VDKSVIPEYFYHATIDENVDGIYERGLQPSTDTNWGGDLGRNSKGKMFFSATPNRAVFYAFVVQSRGGWECELEDGELTKCYPEVVLLRVPSEKLYDIHKERPDLMENDYFVERPVPVKGIELLAGEHCWKPLSKSQLAVEAISEGYWAEQDKPLDERVAEFLENVEYCTRK